jgi:hypothetical protein
MVCLEIDWRNVAEYKLQWMKNSLSYGDPSAVVAGDHLHNPEQIPFPGFLFFSKKSRMNGHI